MDRMISKKLFYMYVLIRVHVCGILQNYTGEPRLGIQYMYIPVPAAAVLANREKSAQCWCLLFQVNEIRHSQKRLEEKLYNIYYIQVALCCIVVAFFLYLFLAFIFDFFPFNGQGCSTMNGCSFNVWRR